MCIHVFKENSRVDCEKRWVYVFSGMADLFSFGKIVRVVMICILIQKLEKESV
jgi:hypothetical protein